MNIYIINPLSDSRWEDLVARHPRASAFHSRGWLEALARTYNYEPLVLTSASPGAPLNEGIVLCRVSSWVTGTRLVSLPFADHCEPLLNEGGEGNEFADWLRAECDRRQWKYVDLRPLFWGENLAAHWQPSERYCFHALDLAVSLERIFKGFHKDSIQRRIRRADREKLAYESGRSEQLLKEFYRLLLITRRRQGLLPQPRTWFRNLVACLGDKVEIRVVRQNGTAIGAMLTLRHRFSVVYKYGCSDKTFHHLGVMPWLFWRLIEESKAGGAEQIDFGRSDLDNTGLIRFKDRFGTRKKLLTYFRYGQQKEEKASARDMAVMRQALSCLPEGILPLAGRLLYRHVG